MWLIITTSSVSKMNDERDETVLTVIIYPIAEIIKQKFDFLRLEGDRFSLRQKIHSQAG